MSKGSKARRKQDRKKVAPTGTGAATSAAPADDFGAENSANDVRAEEAETERSATRRRSSTPLRDFGREEEPREHHVDEDQFFARGEEEHSVPPASFDTDVADEPGPAVTPMYVLERRARFRRIVMGVVGAAAVLTLIVTARALVAHAHPRASTDTSLTVSDHVVASIAIPPAAEAPAAPAAAKPEPSAWANAEPSTAPKAEPATSPAQAAQIPSQIEPAKVDNGVAPKAEPPVQEPAKVETAAAKIETAPKVEPAPAKVEPAKVEPATAKAEAKAEPVKAEPAPAVAELTPQPLSTAAANLAAVKAAVEAATAKSEPTADKATFADAATNKIAARRLIAQGKMKDGITAARASLAGDASDAETYLLLGAALQELGQWKESKSIFAQCNTSATRGPKSECRALAR